MTHSVMIAWVESMSDNFELMENKKIKTAGVCVENKTEFNTILRNFGIGDCK